MNDLDLATRIQEILIEFTELDAANVVYKGSNNVIPTESLIVFNLADMDDSHLKPYVLEGTTYNLRRITVQTFAFGSTSKTAINTLKNIVKKPTQTQINSMRDKGLMIFPFFKSAVELAEKADGTLINALVTPIAFEIWCTDADLETATIVSITLKDLIYPDKEYTGGE